jgi:hypothetical protein
LRLVSFAIWFGQQLKQQVGAGSERLMKMPDPARREPSAR